MNGKDDLTNRSSGLRLAGSGCLAAVWLCLFGWLASCTSGGGPTGPGDNSVLPQEHPAANPYTTIVEGWDLLAPSGNRIHGLLRRPDPDLYPDLRFAAVVYIPGGINPGRLLALGNEVQLLAAAGMVVVTFNAEGRGEDIPEDIISEGTEDHNGFRQQDGLKAIVEWLLALPYVDADNVGIKTQSFGIAMGAGCVGRHPDLLVKYLVDGEGPPSSFVVAQEPWALDQDPSNDKHEEVFGIIGHYSTYRDPGQANRDWWSEREAERFIGNFRGRYLRLQAEWDHSQPPSGPGEIPIFRQPPLWWQCKHAMDMVSAALAGGVPWVRINLEEHGNAVGEIYSAYHRPVYLSGLLADDVWDVRAIIEMARME